MIERPEQHVQPQPPGGRKQRGGGHGWMMVACCIPMLAIAIVLVATGVVGISFIFVAVGCTVLMALMMRGMDHGGMNHGGMNDDGHTGAGTNHSNGPDHGGTRPLTPPPPPTTSRRSNDL